jgi:hypothetical protein
MSLTISQDDLQSFHQNHFSTGAVAHFNLTFLNPNDVSQAQHAEEFAGDDDDGLGYYDDGVKRTLTDEQIAMFRHSEIEALRRQLHKRPASAEHKTHANKETGAVEDEGPQPRDQVAATSMKKNNKKRKGNNGRQQEPKPDLRKRTWDVVDTGLDSLDYD